MKNIKLLTSLILVALFAFGSTAIAADGGKKKGKGGDLLSQLDLSKDQQKAIKDFQKSQAGQRKEIASITDKKEKREKSMELAKAYQAKLKEVLSEEQFAKLQKLQSEARKGKGGDKKKGGKKKKKSE